MDDRAIANYIRELQPVSDQWLAEINAAWIDYNNRLAPARAAYESAKAQLRRKHGMTAIPTHQIGPIRD